MNTLTETEKAYIAGFVDGEGCISIARQKKFRSISLSYSLVFTITQADKTVLEYICSILGIGKIYWNGSSKSYQLIFPPKNTIDVLSLILPYLRVKKKQAELAFEFNNNANWSKGKKIDQETNDIREKYYLEMRNLKDNGLDETRGRKRGL
jgi:hypothetical protein